MCSAKPAVTVFPTQMQMDLVAKPSFSADYYIGFFALSSLSLSLSGHETVIYVLHGDGNKKRVFAQHISIDMMQSPSTLPSAHQVKEATIRIE